MARPSTVMRCLQALGRDLEAARYAADRAFHQYDAADPANRLVAGELERRWNRALARVAEVESRIAAHDAAGPVPVIDPATLGLLASNLKTVWLAPSTDTRLKKRIVRTLIHEVVADIDDAAAQIVPRAIESLTASRKTKSRSSRHVIASIWRPSLRRVGPISSIGAARLGSSMCSMTGRSRSRIIAAIGNTSASAISRLSIEHAFF